MRSHAKPLKCPTCGLLFVKKTGRLWCLIEHRRGECCHVGQWLLCDDGRTIEPVQNLKCIPVDV